MDAGKTLQSEADKRPMEKGGRGGCNGVKNRVCQSGGMSKNLLT